MTQGATPATQWEGRPVSSWSHLLGLPALHIFDSIGSTNDFARECAQLGAAAGTAVLAEFQAQGRGRQGRPWKAAPGSSLMLSFILRPAPAPDAAPGTLPLRVGMAAAAALRDAGVDAHVKWPNDVVVPQHGKIAGVLCEAVGLGSADGFVIAGIGINVRQQPHDWPDALLDVATSVDLCTGRRCDRAQLLGSLTTLMRPLFTQALAPFSAGERAAFAALDALTGSEVVARSPDANLRGTADGVDDDGALRILTGTGLVRVTSGTVRPAASPEQTRL